MKNEIKLYHHPFSNCAQRLILLLAEKQLSYQGETIDLVKSEQLQESFLRINPKGRVPVLALDGQHFNESVDIMLMLEDRFPEPSFSPKDRGRYQLMLQLLQTAKHSHDCVKDYVYSAKVGRLPTDQELQVYQQQDPENANFHHRRRAGLVGCDLKATNERVFADFKQLENYLNDQDWLCGEYSLADMAWFPNTIIFRQCGFDFSPLKSVCQWIERMENRHSYQDTLKDKIDSIPPMVNEVFYAV